VIADCFADIYKRPDYMQENLNPGVQEDDEIVDEMINKTRIE
jgi:hypothetical protein